MLQPDQQLLTTVWTTSNGIYANLPPPYIARSLQKRSLALRAIIVHNRPEFTQIAV